MTMQSQAPVLRHRTKGQRKRCAECGQSIAMNSLFVRVEGVEYHPFCAGDAGKQQACTSCFMLNCEC